MAGNGDVKPKGCLLKLSHAIETNMNGFFSKLGRLVALHPAKTVALALVGVVIGISGVTVLETESRGDKLWLPTGTRAQDDYVSV